MTNLVPVSRKKQNAQMKSIREPSGKTQISKKGDNFDNIIFMSGTAKRKSLQGSNCLVEQNEKSERNFEFPQKHSYREEFFKLRTPYKMRQKNARMVEKVMSKSCEILFECLKPYKDMSSRNSKMQIIQKSQCVRSVLKTYDFNYETKATRKVQFLSIFEETPMPDLFSNGFNLPSELESDAESRNTELDLLQLDEVSKATTNQIKEQLSSSSKGGPKTVSSEDFINNVFSTRETIPFDDEEVPQNIFSVLKD